MRFEPLLPRQSSTCIACPDPIPCNCGPNQLCFQINRDCFSCSQTKCVDDDTPQGSSNSGGASPGALAGGIVGALVFLAAAVLLYLWFRRRSRLSTSLTVDAKPDIPAPAETVLNRPDPIEKLAAPPAEPPTVRVHNSVAETTIDLDSERTTIDLYPEPLQHAQSNRGATSVVSNPFSDTLSLRSAATEGTNVIPIALVASDSHRVSATRPESDTLPQGNASPIRPPRSPELNLNLEHGNISRDVPPADTPHYATSQISGISRNSFMSSASFSSEFLNEAPMIVTPTRGAVRQVVGVVKAEVINAPPTPSTPEGLKPPSISSRPPVGSPLAATSFGPADVVHEVDESQEEPVNPFSDSLSMNVNYDASSPAPTLTTFGLPSPQLISGPPPQWQTLKLNSPWTGGDVTRPSSLTTQAGSVMDQSQLPSFDRNFNGLLSTTLRAQHRNTVDKADSAPLANQPRSGTQLTQGALGHTLAQNYGLPDPKRVSASSVLSATSTRADSILESFPFVPPSPISNRPARTPPVSPLAQQSFTAAPPSPLAQQASSNPPRSPTRIPTRSDFAPSIPSAPSLPQSEDDELPAPPDRRTLGLSTASQLTISSSGLGPFPFHIDPGASTLSTPPHPSLQGRQRASLDTLALTSDLSSYPLGFERDAAPPLPKQSSG